MPDVYVCDVVCFDLHSCCCPAGTRVHLKEASLPFGNVGNVTDEVCSQGKHHLLDIALVPDILLKDSNDSNRAAGWQQDG